MPLPMQQASTVSSRVQPLKLERATTVVLLLRRTRPLPEGCCLDGTRMTRHKQLESLLDENDEALMTRPLLHVCAILPSGGVQEGMPLRASLTRTIRPNART